MYMYYEIITTINLVNIHQHTVIIFSFWWELLRSILFEIYSTVLLSAVIMVYSNSQDLSGNWKFVFLFTILIYFTQATYKLFLYPYDRWGNRNLYKLKYLPNEWWNGNLHWGWPLSDIDNEPLCCLATLLGSAMLPLTILYLVSSESLPKIIKDQFLDSLVLFTIQS